MDNFKHLIIDALGRTPAYWQTYIPLEHMTVEEWHIVVQDLTELVCDEFETCYFTITNTEIDDYATRPLGDLSMLIEFKLRLPGLVMTRQDSMRLC